MSPRVMNVYNIHPQKQTDYTKEKINRSMSFAQVGNDLNEDTVSFLQHKGMEHSKDTIDHETVIAYSFTQHSPKRGLKELGKGGYSGKRGTVSATHEGYIPSQIS